MGKEQMGREEGGLTTNEARKRFGGRKRGVTAFRGREQNDGPQNIAVHLMAGEGAGGNPGV